MEMNLASLFGTRSVAKIERLPFDDRADAGCRLGKRLGSYANAADAVVLALTNNGVPVGVAVAAELNLRCYPYTVCKVGHPRHPDFSVGAITEGGHLYLDSRALFLTGATEASIQPAVPAALEQVQELAKQFAAFKRPALAGKRCIVTVDGAADGNALLAVISDLINSQASRVIVAVPVCPGDLVAQLQRAAHEVVVLASPPAFRNVSQWYKRAEQLAVDDVVSALGMRKQNSGYQLAVDPATGTTLGFGADTPDPLASRGAAPVASHIVVPTTQLFVPTV